MTHNKPAVVESLEADYLVVGGGAMGMAFADVMVAESDASLVVVDRRHQPGGHWNDAYPFVRLHQPSQFYGVNSTPLGRDTIDTSGYNAGLYELAGKHEVCDYFARVMQRLVDCERVRYLPLCDYRGDGRVDSLLSNRQYQVNAGKVVDANYMHVEVPATRKPRYQVAGDAHCLPPNALACVDGRWQHFVIIGAGKTAVDSCLFLLDNGVAPDLITWIKPRESWYLNRAKAQAGEMFETSILELFTGQIRAAAASESMEDLFARLSEQQLLLRIDEQSWPTMYRCATVTESEIKALRQIDNVVRMGRVQRVEADRLVLDAGTLAVEPGALFVDCTADGLERRPGVPVFAGDRIILQSVRTCQQVFSAAFIAHVEATESDEASKNSLCTPVPHPDTDVDLMRNALADLANAATWSQDAALQEWLKHARLDGWTSPQTSPEADAALAAEMLPVALQAAEKLQAHLAARGED